MTDITYDLGIDCAVDWDPKIAVTRNDATTGEAEAYAGITGLTGTLSADRGSATGIHATLQGLTFVEYSGTPGTVHPSPSVDVATLQARLLPTYRKKTVWLNLFLANEIVGEPLKCLVGQDRLDLPEELR